MGLNEEDWEALEENWGERQNEDRRIYSGKEGPWEKSVSKYNALKG